MSKNIAILGGTFDPIHLGHIKMAEAVLSQIDVDEVYFMPSKIPPHKLNKNVTSEEHRCNMVKIAIKNNNKLKFSDFDLIRDNISYTADTLTLLKKDNKDLNIYFIIGGDSLKNIKTWYRPDIVLSNCTLLTIMRDDVDSIKMKEIIDDLIKEFNAKIIPINMDKIDISSTKIRNDLVTNRDYGAFADVLDKNVFDYIIENDLYKTYDCEIVMATEEDRNDILKLYKLQLGREFCPWTDDYPSNETIDFDLRRDALFIMKSKDKIIAAISIEEDENVDKLDCWSDSITPSGELARLAVLPEWQNKGIAKQMLLYGMKQLKLRGFNGIHFLVNKMNIKAIKAYSSFNFNVVGECFMYDENFLCYEKEL